MSQLIDAEQCATEMPVAGSVDHLTFALPTGDIFVGGNYAGTIYRWNDGSEEAVWASGAAPDLTDSESEFRERVFSDTIYR